MTAIPSSVAQNLEDPSAYFESLATATVTPDWYTSAVPTSAQAVFSSAIAENFRIVSQNAEGPAPTNAAKVAGVFLAAGGAAMAML